ncbi:cytochrome P450 [Tumebacillus flagellatus]|uniref:Cytochrome P450 n=1 Tax=Tumebacillus flagellatus TaxID=1157490 RepID=A0A074LPV1_9BACL|nr:cytochrome P450 [Tumebacillus flagellatus]KEO84141.1 cytochrome P450 [Tumebacillus flagellatus]
MEQQKRQVRSGIMTPVKGLMTREERLNPFAFFQNMRETAPVRYDQDRDTWDVFRYEDVYRVLSDHTTFSSNRNAVLRSNQSSDNASLIAMDPPQHTKYRNIVNRAFTPKRVQDLAPRIEEITRELLDAVEGTGEVDLIREFAGPLPVIVIADILGIPAADRHLFKEWSDKLVESPHAQHDEAYQASMMEKARVSQELGAYFKKQLDARRVTPGDDLLTVLLEAEVEGERLNEQQLLSFCLLLLVAGNETTTNLITNAVRAFAEQPELQTKLRENPDLIPSAVEEALRYYSPVAAIPSRFATQDVELGGQWIKQGDQVVAWLNSANRDEAKFPNADQFLVDRNPNPHLAFGWGIHFCLGAPLARLEGQIALKAIIERMPNIRFKAGTELQPVTSTLVFAVKELPITFDVK